MTVADVLNHHLEQQLRKSFSSGQAWRARCTPHNNLRISFFLPRHTWNSQQMSGWKLSVTSASERAVWVSHHGGAISEAKTHLARNSVRICSSKNLFIKNMRILQILRSQHSLASPKLGLLLMKQVTQISSVCMSISVLDTQLLAGSCDCRCLDTWPL